MEKWQWTRMLENKMDNTRDERSTELDEVDEIRTKNKANWTCAKARSVCGRYREINGKKNQKTF